MESHSNQKIQQILLKSSGYSWYQDDNGEWLWKADSPTPLSNKKVKYQDKIEFKASETIEIGYLQSFNVIVRDAVKKMSSFLANEFQ